MASHLQYFFTLFALFSLVVPLVSCQATSNTVLATFVGLPIPTPVPGDSTYTLLGCYVEPPTSSDSRALGAAGTYITPAGLDASSLTVEQCLQACATTLGSTGADAYPYAGLENANECYCSPVLLTNITHIVSSGFCTSPCSGNSTTACGGYGYVDVYQLTSNINTISSPLSSPTTTTSSTRSPSSSRSLTTSSSSKPSTTVSTSTSSFSSPTPTTPIPPPLKSSLSSGAIAGITIGSIAGLILLLLLCYSLRRCHKKKQEKDQATPRPISVVDAPGFLSPDPRRNGIIYPSNRTSPRPWEVRDPQVGATPDQSLQQSQNESRPLNFVRDGNQSRPTFISGGPSELEGDGDHSVIGTYNDEDLLEGFNDAGGRERVDSWRAGDDEGLKRGYEFDSLPPPFPIGQDRAELGTGERDRVVGLGRTKSYKRGEVVESPVLGKSVPLVVSVEEEWEGESTDVSAMGTINTTTATGGWSPTETAARKKRGERKFEELEKLGRG